MILLYFLSYELSRMHCFCILLHQWKHWVVKMAVWKTNCFVLLCFAFLKLHLMYMAQKHEIQCIWEYGIINILLKSEMFLWSNLKLCQSMQDHMVIPADYVEDHIL